MYDFEEYDVEIGDVVEIISHEDLPQGTVTTYNPQNDRYRVKFLNESLIPPEMEYNRLHLRVVKKTNLPSQIKCECGVDSLGYGLHSDWCPKDERR